MSLYADVKAEHALATNSYNACSRKQQTCRISIAATQNLAKKAHAIRPKTSANIDVLPIATLYVNQTLTQLAAWRHPPSHNSSGARHSSPGWLPLPDSPVGLRCAKQTPFHETTGALVDESMLPCIARNCTSYGRSTLQSDDGILL